MDNQTQKMTRSLASDDFDTMLAELPGYQAEVERRVATAPDDAAREVVLLEALAMNQRWLSLAKSLESNMRQQLRSLTAEAHYSESDDRAHIVETTG